MEDSIDPCGSRPLGILNASPCCVVYSLQAVQYGGCIHYWLIGDLINAMDTVCCGNTTFMSIGDHRTEAIQAIACMLSIIVLTIIKLEWPDISYAARFETQLIRLTEEQTLHHRQIQTKRGGGRRRLSIVKGGHRDQRG